MALRKRRPYLAACDVAQAHRDALRAHDEYSRQITGDPEAHGYRERTDTARDAMIKANAEAAKAGRVYARQWR